MKDSDLRNRRPFNNILLFVKEAAIKTEAIRSFLRNKTLKDLADLYTPEMEVQVNVIRAHGERASGEYKGRTFTQWTDGSLFWKSFRIPNNAMDEPVYEDHPLNFPLHKFVDAVGLTGWNFVKCQSEYVAFDFDSVVNHNEGISPEELDDVQRAAQDIPWITARRSTSGKGLHLYAMLEPIKTKNHTEHAAVARAVLSKMASLTGYNFNSKVDVCGGNIWVWSRKAEKAIDIDLLVPEEFQLKDESFELIKSNTSLLPKKNIENNWREHMDVIKRKTTKKVYKKDMNECVSAAPNVKLDKEHQRVLKWFEEHGEYSFWWDADNNLFVCHTLDLQKCHEELELLGLFETKSSGTSDKNCFMYPIEDGAWSVRRYGQGVNEAPCWLQDPNSWTQIYFNRRPTFAIAAAAGGGTMTEKSGYMFDEVGAVNNTLITIGADYEVPKGLEGCAMFLRATGNVAVLTVLEPPVHLLGKGWVKKTGKKYERTLPINVARETLVTENVDHMLRHLVDANDKGVAWCVNSGGRWISEPAAEINRVLQHKGFKAGEATQIMGASVLKPFRLVVQPFEPEYPAPRQWNKGAPQFNYEPSPGIYPTWMSILDHIGRSLDPFVRQHGWCTDNQIFTGSDYLKCWIASLFQFPTDPLPYLFIYSNKQQTGKTTFHESLSLLFNPGVVRAENAITGSFNSQLESAVLCVVEEENLPKQSITKIKDWVTSEYIAIRKMYTDTFLARNFTHWVQTANDFGACPVFPGDTRITVINVRDTPPNSVGRTKLQVELKKEAPAFLHEVLNLEVPPHDGRLRIPIIETDDKLMMEDMNGTDIDRFMDTRFRYEPGESITLKDFLSEFNKFMAARGAEVKSYVSDHDVVTEGVAGWNRSRIQNALNMERFPIGNDKEMRLSIGNVARKEDPYKANDYRLIPVNGMLTKEKI